MSDVLPPLDDHGFASVTNAVLSHFPFGPVKTNDGLKMHTPPPTSTWHAHRLLPPSALSHCLVGLNGVVRRIDAGSRLTASPSTQGAHNGHHAVHCFVLAKQKWHSGWTPSSSEELGQAVGVGLFLWQYSCVTHCHASFLAVRLGPWLLARLPVSSPPSCNALRHPRSRAASRWKKGSKC